MNRDDQLRLIQESVVDGMIRGRSAEEMRDELETRLQPDEARALLERAQEEFHSLKSSGTLQEREFEIYTGRRNRAFTLRDAAGVLLLIGGLGGSAYGYLTAAPGTKFSIYVGLILAGIVLLFAPHLRGSGSGKA